MISDNDINVDASTRGTIIHSFLEHLKIIPELDFKQEVIRLKESNLFNDDEWSVIERYLPHLQEFVASDVFSLMANSQHLYQEKEFSMLENGQIIHGIFDVVCINNDEITVIDYKTDNLNKNTDDKTLIALHPPQLEYYKKILARIFKSAKIKAIVYYLHIDRYVSF